jgi:integrase/recombinase XerC
MSYMAVIGTPTIFDSLDIAESTKQDYLARLPRFAGWLKINGLDFDTLLKYKHYLRDRTDLGVASKNKYLAVARIALKELHRRGKLPVDITYNVKSFQQNQKHKVDGLNEDEVSKLVDYLNTLPVSYRSARLKAVFALLLFQGLRQIEIVRLDVSDIDIASKRAYVLGKGRDDKESIHLHPHTINALKTFLKVSPVKHGPLFTSLNGKTRGQRLTTRGLRMIVKDVMEMNGIEKTVHGFRHYFATQLIKNYDGDLLEISRYTRHRSIEMLQTYNDEVLEHGDLPKYYEVFESVPLGTTL